MRRFALILITVAALLPAASLCAQETVAPQETDRTASVERLSRLAERLSADGVALDPTDIVEQTPDASRPSDAASVEAATGPAARPLGVPSEPARTLPRPRSESTDSGWIWSTLAALGVVIGLILVIRAVYARLGGTVVAASSPVVEVLSRTSVAPRNHVLLLRVGERVLIVSDSPGGMRTLAQVHDPDEVASLLGAVAAAKPTSVSASFSQMLGRMHADFDSAESAEQGGDIAEHRSDQAQDALGGLLSRVRRLSEGGGR